MKTHTYWYLHGPSFDRVQTLIFENKCCFLHFRFRINLKVQSFWCIPEKHIFLTIQSNILQMWWTFFFDFVSPWSGFKVNEWERISFLWFSPAIYISACISRLYDITRWIYQAVQMSVAIEVVVLGRSKQWGARTQYEEIWGMRS